MHPPTTNGDEDDRRRNGDVIVTVAKMSNGEERAPLGGQFLHTPPPFSILTLP
jgi:hypothetical protein